LLHRIKFSHVKGVVLLNNKFFLLPVALLAVSSSAWVIKAFPDTSVITFAFWRMFLASIFVFILSYKTISLFVPNKKMELAGIFLGAHFILFFKAVELTSVAEATLLGTTAPIFTELYNIFYKKKKVVRAVLFGLFLAFLGGGFLISQSTQGEGSLFGNLCAILCSLAMALVLIVGKEVRKSFSVLDYTRWLFFYASFAVLFVSFLAEVSVFSFSWEEFRWFLFLAAVPTVIGHNIFYYLIKSLSTTTVAAVPLGEPVVSSVGAFFLFGEPITLAVALGGSITLFGVFLVVRFGN
tara:strand:+ start:8579 stop:9463 length:885 start_codon:yes stop_codon:yes gene_type:complete